MNHFYLKLKENLGLTLILAIGLGVEFSNFQAMFFRFMTQYRPDWGAFNHLPAICLSAFLLLCIVIFGIRKQTGLSWFLAMLTCVISFSVYSRMNLSWEWEKMNEVHFVILILSGMLPMLVAYTTHQIAKTDDGFYDEDQHKLEGFIHEIRRRQLQKQQQQQHFSHNHHAPLQNVHTNNTHTHSHNTHTPPFEFEDETPETYKKKVSYDRSNMIRPEKPKTEGTKNDNIKNDNAKNEAIKNEMPEVQSCEECGTTMEGKRKGTKYCSKDCSLTAQKRRRNQQYEESMRNQQVSASVSKPVSPVIQRTAISNHQYNSAEFDTNTYTFEVQPASRKENNANYQTPIGGSQKNEVITNMTNEENTFVCESCGKTARKRSQHSRYCSEVCRISGLRAKKKSDFFVRQDDFETNGFIEWANPGRTV
jgi:hypothetical protein